MTVQELIDELNKVENKNPRVTIFCFNENGDSEYGDLTDIDSSLKV
jgi:hypothetical protein